MSHANQMQATAQQEASTAPAFASILIVDDSDFDRSRLKNFVWPSISQPMW